jgi:hypothetical protein
MVVHTIDNGQQGSIGLKKTTRKWENLIGTIMLKGAGLGVSVSHLRKLQPTKNGFSQSAHFALS